MDIFDLSPKGKKRFVTWMGKRHRELSIAELIRNVPDERTLFKMCRYIDRWYDANEPSMEPIKASMELSEDIEVQRESSGDAQEDTDEVIPDVAQIVKPEAPKPEQKELSKRTKGRLSDLVLNHPDVCVSEIVQNAADEAEILKVISEIENRFVPVDIRVKMWTVRQVI